MEAGDVATQLRVLGEIALAMLLGGVVGIEREWRGKPAGMRTLMLISGAACFFTGIGEILVLEFRPVAAGADLRPDPLRILEAVVAGVSFLGAGAIIRHTNGGSGIEGLTTGASMLFVAAVGVSVATLNVVAAAGAALLVLAVLAGLGPVEGWIARRRAARDARRPT